MAFLWIIFMMGGFSHFVQTAGNDCFFTEDTAWCSSMSYIPPIPPYISQLVLIRNNFPVVTQGTFKNVTMPDNIHTMWLAQCHIVNITSDAFDPFVALSLLDLSYNDLSSNVLKLLLLEFSENLHLDSLYMSGVTGISNVNVTFSLLNKSPSAKLDLSGNSIGQIADGVMQRLHTIEVLNLDNDNLTKLHFANMSSLVELSIANNWFQELPTFCSGETSLTPNLKRLHLGGSNISVLLKNTFKCLPHLLEARISDSSLTYIESDLFYYTPHVSSLYLDTVQISRLDIQRNLFSSPTLKTLRMKNVRSFDLTSDVFQGLTNLKGLEINSSHLENKTENRQFELFSPLTALINITLYKCGLYGGTENILDNKPHLQNIFLPNNRFKTLSLGIYMHNLRTMHLSNNDISQIFQERFSEEVLNGLQVLDLSNNPFSCDCNIAWFIDWLKSTNTSKLVNFPSQYLCGSPPELAGKLLTDVHFSYSDCHHFSTAEWVGVIAGPLLGIILLLSVVIYRNRWNIKHYIYLMRKRRNYVQIEGRDYEYDAFVAYTQENYEWAVHFLLPLLEDEFHLKVCMHDRDFRAGTFINDNIVECMSKSRRIILVLSNAFAKSGWCMFELKVANSFHIQESVEVVVIVLEEILARNMNRAMELLLETTTYLEWTDQNDVGHELFLTRLKDAMGV